MVWCFPFMQFCIEHLKLIIMKNLLLLFTTVLIGNFAAAQAVLGWTSGLPSVATNNHTIATDSQGNVYTIGIHDTNYDFDPGSGVFNLVCYTNPYSASLTSMYINKTDAAGNFIWAKQIGGGSTTNYETSNATAITIDTSNNIYIAGSSRKLGAGAILDFDPGVGVVDVPNPPGVYVMYILKLDANGNYLWNAQFDNTLTTASDSQNTVQAMKVDAAGNLFATGGFFGTVDFDPRTGVSNITSTVPNNNLSSDIFILKLDAAGNFGWAKALLRNGTYASYTTNLGYGIDLDSSGNIYTTGIFTDSIDVDPSAGVTNLVAYKSTVLPLMNGLNAQYIAKFDSSGNYVWAYPIAGDHNVGSNCSLVIDNSNNVIVSGNTYKTFTGSTNVNPIRDLDFGAGTFYLPADTDAFLLKLNTNAGFIWAKSTTRGIAPPLGSDNTVLGLAVDGLGNIFTTGSFGSSGTVDFDPSASNFNLTTAGLTDGYISKLDANGNFVFANKFGGSGGNEKGYSIVISPQGKILVNSSSDTGFAKTSLAVSPGGFMASYTQPALATNQFELDQNSTIYPNPSSGNYNITINENLIGAKVTVYSLLGQKVKAFILDVLTTNQNLDAGMYLLEIEKEGNSITKKLLVN